jgi:hypothetical protein
LKALSIRQPWASLIATGLKTIETRTWATPHRGELLICAARNRDARAEPADLPTGVALAIVRLIDVREMRPEDTVPAGVPYQDGLWAWLLEEARAIEPFAVRGQLRLFEVDNRSVRRSAKRAGVAGDAAAIGQRLLY